MLCVHMLCAHDCNANTHANLFYPECVMATVCVLCVYICTLTVSVQFSRGQPGKPVCTDGTDIARTTARNWRPDQSGALKKLTSVPTNPQLRSLYIDNH